MTEQDVNGAEEQLQRLKNLEYLPDNDISGHISPMTGKWYPAQGETEVRQYAEVIYLELYETYTQRVKTKRQTLEAYRFSKEAGKVLFEIAGEIASGKWLVRGYLPFSVHHPDRIINAPFYVDRIVEQWLMEKYFIPVLTPHIYEYNMACQKNKGPDLARNVIKVWMEEMYLSYGNEFYILQFDCKKYFDNISHSLAYSIFDRYGVCDFALRLYKAILDSFHEDEDDPECYAARDHRGSGELFGVPKGNLPSQWTGIMYLNELDWMLRRDTDICIKNIRYMDDGLCFCGNRADARRCLKKIEKYLKDNDCGTILHPKKTNIYPMTRGTTFCGWHYTMDKYGHIRITEKNAKKWEQIKRLKSVWKGLHNGTVSIDKASQIRYGVLQYISRGTEGIALTHKILKEFQLFPGEYETYYAGKMNPLGIRNPGWDDPVL